MMIIEFNIIQKSHFLLWLGCPSYLASFDICLLLLLMFRLDEIMQIFSIWKIKWMIFKKWLWFFFVFIADQHILTELEKEGILVYTPSRLLNNRRLICYDDRYILKLAVDVDGIVVSNDNYRDLTIESLDFKRIVEEKLLMYSFVNDRYLSWYEIEK